MGDQRQTEKIGVRAEMEPFPGFPSEPAGEGEIKERLEEERREPEESTTGRESRTESERQDGWSDEEDGSLADDEDDGDDDDHGKSFAFTPLVKIVTKMEEKQTEDDKDTRDGVTREGDMRNGDMRGGDLRRSGDMRGGVTSGGDTRRGGEMRGGEMRSGVTRRSGDMRGGVMSRGDTRRSGDMRSGDMRGPDVTTHQGNTGQTRFSSGVCCGEMMSSVMFAVVGAVMFPLLVWGGNDLLPLDVPSVMSAPFRLVYTLRCALFATFPIILGVLVHGVSRLKFSSLNPLFVGKRASRHTLVHMTFVHDSLRLFLLFFLQLAVTSTYLQQHTLKLLPLLTIVFVFGMLIYWPSVCFSSSVRVLGFSLSFLPVLTLMGFNLYFICSSTGEGAVFDVAPPTTAPPPKARWWG